VSNASGGQKDGGRALASSDGSSCERVKDGKAKKPKPIREESFPAELVFRRNDFSYVDGIVDPDRAHRAGPKGYLPSAMFMALLLMYLKEIRSILDLVRFLGSNPEWLRILGLKKRIGGVETYSVPDRTRFYRFARRVGVDGMVEILSVMVVRLMREGIIKGKSVSLDATIVSAWFKDCRVRKSEEHLKRCRHEKSKDGDASWGYDHHRNRYVYGYKVHVLLDSATALPIAITITAAGYGENRAAGWFVAMILRLGVRVEKFFADAGYDSYATRLLVIEKLKAVPFIPFNPGSCKGSTYQEKVARCTKLRRRWYVKSFLKRWWVDPASKRFDREYDVRTLSEQGFSVGKGSLRLDSLMHGGREWATLHSVAICVVMLAVANTAVEIGRPDLMRCVRCFNG
jgi:IS5 family transposase